MPADAEEIVRLTLVAVVGVMMLSVVASLSLGGSASVSPATGDNVTVDDRNEIPSNVDVSATKENALRFPDGAGYVDGPGLDNGSKTVCATGRLDGSANSQATYTLYGAENGSVLLQYDAGSWMGYVEDNGSSAKATLNAPNPDEWRQSCLRYNATASTITLSRDDTVTGPVALDSNTERRNASHDWFGTVDEVRTFGNPVPNATLTAYADDSIQPFPDENRTGRYMFDEGSGDTTTVYWAGTEAAVVNATWTDGLSDVNLDRGSDYVIYSDPFRLFTTASGYLAGAPVIFVSWSLIGGSLNWLSLIGTFMAVGLLYHIAERSGLLS